MHSHTAHSLFSGHEIPINLWAFLASFVSYIMSDVILLELFVKLFSTIFLWYVSLMKNFISIILALPASKSLLSEKHFECTQARFKILQYTWWKGSFSIVASASVSFYKSSRSKSSRSLNFQHARSCSWRVHFSGSQQRRDMISATEAHSTPSAQAKERTGKG